MGTPRSLAAASSIHAARMPDSRTLNRIQRRSNVPLFRKPHRNSTTEIPTPPGSSPAWCPRCRQAVGDLKPIAARVENRHRHDYLAAPRDSAHRSRIAARMGQWQGGPAEDTALRITGEVTLGTGRARLSQGCVMPTRGSTSSSPSSADLSCTTSTDRNVVRVMLIQEKIA